MKYTRMNSQNKYVGIVLLSALSLTTYAQDKKDMFNPVNSAVTSHCPGRSRRWYG